MVGKAGTRPVTTRPDNRGRTGRSVRANEYCAFSTDGARGSAIGGPSVHKLRIYRARTRGAVPLVLCDEICLSGDGGRNDGQPTGKLFCCRAVQSCWRRTELLGGQ